MTTVDRRELARRIGTVTAKGPHRPAHIAAFVRAVLARPVPGMLVECGAYQGVSTAKLSHIADMLGRRLVVFDSFEGLPPNDEPHTVTTRGRDIRGRLAGGAYAGTLAEVQATVARYGVPEVVQYVPGWFVDTLPRFDARVAAAFVDVDLAASATTCLTHLWPLLAPGGVIVSHDGHLPLTVTAMREWAAAASPRPRVAGLGEQMIVRFRRPGGGRYKRRVGGGRGRRLPGR
nr:TylF/MycF/NovP-related O-methyltransferase [Micromonospora sp. DSM 115978]